MKSKQQEITDTFLSTAKRKLEEVGEGLLKRKIIANYILKVDDDIFIVFEALRRSDNVPIRFDIYRDKEVVRTFDNSYRLSLFPDEYFDEDEQLEAFYDLVDDIRFFMESKDYYEEIYEKNGKIIFKKLIRSSGYAEGKSIVFAGRIRRYFGSSKRIVRPD